MLPEDSNSSEDDESEKEEEDVSTSNERIFEEEFKEKFQLENEVDGVIPSDKKRASTLPTILSRPPPPTTRAPVRRRSTKRKAPSPPVNIAPFNTSFTKSESSEQIVEEFKEIDKNDRPLSSTSISSANAPASVFENKNESLLSEIFNYLGKKDDEKGSVNEETKVEALPYGEGYELPGVKLEDKESLEKEKHEKEFEERRAVLQQILMEDFMEDSCNLTLDQKDEEEDRLYENDDVVKTPSKVATKEIHISQNTSSEEEDNFYETIDDGVGSAVAKENLNLQFNKDENPTDYDDSLHGSHMPSPLKQVPPQSVTFISYHNLITPMSFTKTSPNNSLKPSKIIHAPQLLKRSPSTKPPLPPKPLVNT